MRTYKADGVVIGKRNFLEKDRILTLFTKEYGKMDVIAKGARRPGSRLSYVSDLGTIAQFHVTKTRSIDIALEAKVDFIPDKAFGDLDKSNKIFYALKTVKKAYHDGEPHQLTYQALVELIKSTDHNNQLGFIFFVSMVIRDLGIAPELSKCISCDRRLSKRDNFDFNLKGGISHCDCDTGDKEPCSVDAVKIMKLLFGRDAVRRSAQINHGLYSELYRILSCYINWHLGDILPGEEV